MRFKEAGLDVAVDKVGNVFGIWNPDGVDPDHPVLMLGSHIDTVINAGIYEAATELWRVWRSFRR